MWLMMLMIIMIIVMIVIIIIIVMMMTIMMSVIMMIIMIIMMMIRQWPGLQLNVLCLARSLFLRELLLLSATPSEGTFVIVIVILVIVTILVALIVILRKPHLLSENHSRVFHIAIFAISHHPQPHCFSNSESP